MSTCEFVLTYFKGQIPFDDMHIYWVPMLRTWFKHIKWSMHLVYISGICAAQIYTEWSLGSTSPTTEVSFLTKNMKKSAKCYQFMHLCFLNHLPGLQSLHNLGHTQHFVHVRSLYKLCHMKTVLHNALI